MPQRPDPDTVRTAIDEIAARRRRANDSTLEQLSDQEWEVLEYLKRHPSRRADDKAADGQAALIIQAELKWQLLEYETSTLLRLNTLPEDVRPANSTVGIWIGSGLHRQSVRDRRDRNTALLKRGPGHNEHDTRAERAAAREHDARAETEDAWLARHATQLHALRGKLLGLSRPVASAETLEWLDETERDHADEACGRLALATLRLVVNALREDLGPAEGDEGELPAVFAEVDTFLNAMREHRNQQA